MLANELVNHLAAAGDSDEVYRVGDDLVVRAGKYVTSRPFASSCPAMERLRSQELDATPSAGQLVAKLPDVATSGVYHAELSLRKAASSGATTRSTWPPKVRETSSWSAARIFARQLAGLNVQLHDAADMAANEQHLAGFQMGDTLLGILILLLLGEQVLAHRRVITFGVDKQIAPEGRRHVARGQPLEHE